VLVEASLLEVERFGLAVMVAFGYRRRGALDLTLRTGLSTTNTYTRFQTGLTRISDDLTLPIVAVICIISLSLPISQIAA